jgi:predicted dehydrogenase
VSTSREYHPDPEIRCKDYKIGCIGAGFIMADVQLAAYASCGFDVAAIASRTEEKAKAVAKRWNIKKCYRSPTELLEDETLEVIDIAYPPHLQIELVREAVTKPHIKALLLQKPVAMNFDEATEIARLCSDAGKVVSVNQNMRFDQSMRVLKQLLDDGVLGEPVIGSIEMRAIPHWAPFLVDYDRLTLLNMSIHHLDIMRFLFGEVDAISVMARKDPRTAFEHTDGICVSSLKFQSGVIGVCLDDVWASPNDDRFDPDVYIKWRVEGTDGVAQGTIGWPDYPNGSPSTLSYYAADTDGKWVTPSWSTMWFPDAFGGVMEQLQYAIRENEEPEIGMTDNLRTMALVDAAYKSVREHRTVSPSEFQ